MAGVLVEGQLPIAIGEVETRKEFGFGFPNFLDALVNGANGVLVREGFEIEKTVVEDYAKASAVLLGDAKNGGIMARVGSFNETRVEPTNHIILDEL